MKFIFALLLLLTFVRGNAYANGYQASVGAGIDKPYVGETRAQASLLQMQFSTYTRLLRLQSAFSYLNASGYTEGEAAFGVALYLVSPFVSKYAPIHPFVSLGGTFGLGTLDEKSRMDTGFYYGAGVDLLFWERSGFTVSVSQQNAKEKTLRYVLGIFWSRGSFDN